jgi:hypothetical protein
MNLTYRGVAYKSFQPAVEMVELEVGGKYRGATWKLVSVTKVPMSQSLYPQKYRGIAYGGTTLMPASDMSGTEPALS